MLHKKGGIQLGTHSEQEGPPTAEGPGLNPLASALRSGAGALLGKQTEQKGPTHQLSTPIAHSKNATHWTFAPRKPHGTTP